MEAEKTVLSEAVYRAIVEGSTIAKVMINRQGVIVLINAQVERLFGYARDDLVGKPIEVLVPAAIRGRHPGMRDSYFKEPKPRFMGVGRDLSGTRRDGSEFPVEVGLYPIKTDEGEFVVATINDITERKRADEKFRAVVEAAPTAMIMINETGDIVLTNAQTSKLFGYGAAELLGKKVDLLVPDAVRPGHPKLRDSFFADPRPRQMGAGRDLNGRRKDGSLMPVEIGLNPIVTSEGKFAIAAIADISERKRAEEKMRDAAAQKQSSQYARSLIEASLDPLVTISAEGKITDVNEGSIKVTGVSREALIGTDFSNYFTEPEKARAGYEEVFSRGSVTDYPLTVRHVDGRLTDVLYNASVYKDINGNVLGVFAAARDVTAQKHAEAEVSKQRNRELERMVELERFQKLTVGRELKMIELKKEIEELTRRLESARQQAREAK
ncbi:MAG: PAS domain S-box protein [Pseudomonadota bacterium]